MNFSNFGTQDSVMSEYVKHLVIVLIIAVLTPLFTAFGLRRELKLIEQIAVILLIFLTVELFIYLVPFIINSFKSIFRIP